MTEPDDTALWAQFLRVSQAVLGAVEADLKAAGHPPLAWYDALLELRRAGAAGLRPYLLGERMLLAQYTLSRLIERLDRAGLVERHPCPEDGRGQVVRITAAGRALLDRVWPDYRAAIARRMLDRLEPEDAAALARILDKLDPGR